MSRLQLNIEELKSSSGQETEDEKVCFTAVLTRERISLPFSFFIIQILKNWICFLRRGAS